MSRSIGTVVRGIRTGIVKEGDNLVKMVSDSILEAGREGNIQFNDKDVIGVTEAIVARASR